MKARRARRKFGALWRWAHLSFCHWRRDALVAESDCGESVVAPDVARWSTTPFRDWRENEMIPVVYLVEELAAVEAPDGDEHYPGGDTGQNADLGQHFEQRFARPQHVGESFHRPVDQREFAYALNVIRHECDGETRAANGAHGDDDKGGDTIRRGCAGRDGGDEHAERRTRCGRAQADGEQGAAMTEDVEAEKHTAGAEERGDLNQSEDDAEEKPG